MNRWLSGHLFWPATERVVGRDTLRRFRSLLGTDLASAEALRAVQTEKLRGLIRVADRHCPFHARRFREAGLDAADPALGVDDLSRLPLLTRDEIRENLAELTWPGCPGGARPYATGGSSGEPLKFHFDRRRQAADWATRWRARSWWGIRPGDREVMLWGAPAELRAQDRLRDWRDRLLNQRLLSAFHMTVGRMNDYMAFLRIYRPACIYGYPSSLALLARHAHDSGKPPGWLGSPALRAVFVTGEVLLDADRLDIVHAFGAPLVVEYGCRDGGLLACGCRDGLLHVPEENVIVEVLGPDGSPVPPGEAGDVVVTHLECHAMPIIRYRVGDEARRGPTACACGRCSMTLAEVNGRVTDQIVCRDGTGAVRRMHALSLIYVLREADGLRQFRITQPSLDALDVEVVVGAGFTSDVERAVVKGLRARVGPQVSIRILRKTQIAPTASGKHACVVSAVAGEPALAEAR